MISQVTFSQIYIRTNETRYNDWPSFVEWVKAQGGKATIANVSKEGSMERVTMKFITDATGMEIQQISFDKGAPRYGALLGGQVDALFEQPGDVRKFLDADNFKPILTIFDDRPSVFADVPTHREMGMDFDPLLRFRGFYVHKDAPADRVAVAAVGVPARLLPGQLPGVQRVEVHDRDRQLSRHRRCPRPDRPLHRPVPRGLQVDGHGREVTRPVT